MVPFLEERIKQFMDVGEMRRREIGRGTVMTKTPIDYYKMFYNDTAIYGNTAGLMCGYSFCGADHLLFAVDFPLGCMEYGNRNYRQTLNAIENMQISEEDRKKIYEDNARKLFRLPI
jgi:aminocarboxymuconate-semialdehyde decarboxylase